MFIIDGKLDGLNEYTDDCRASKFSGYSTKKRNELQVRLAVVKYGQKVVKSYPIHPTIIWYDATNRDVDNIIFAKKFIMDALQKQGIIQNDSRRYVDGYTDIVRTDKKHPRIVVYLDDYDGEEDEKEYEEDEEIKENKKMTAGEEDEADDES